MKFMNHQGNIVKTIEELQEGKRWEEFLKENEPIWTKMAHFMGYDGPILIPDVPIYLSVPLPKNLDESELNRFLNKSVKNIVSDWAPNFDIAQAKLCEQKLLKEGKYNVIKIDRTYSNSGSMGAESVGMNVVKINYSNSLNYKELQGKGPSELEAICNACIEFHDNKKEYKRNFSGVTIDNTEKHP